MMALNDWNLLHGDAHENTANGVDSSSFSHNPLDHDQASIRLLRILPKRSEFGLIQCELIHATVDASYTCLSYVWGPAARQRLILINGKLFKVRENLWQFLSATCQAYQQLSSIWYWIDALCINQENTVERNHQVAQMGTIYRGAQSMLIWMGIDESTTRLLKVALEAWRLMARCNTFSQFQDAGTQNTDICNLQVAKDLLGFMLHVYWTRAWITQEVLLARNIQLLTDRASVESEQLRPICYLRQGTWWLPMYLTGKKSGCLKGNRWDVDCQVSQHVGQRLYGANPLVKLVGGFPGHISQIPQDQIYSLLSLADIAHKLPVDYRVPAEEFSLQLIETLHRTLCLYSLECLANAMPSACKICTIR
ncbi:HET-domain-containing protein [Macroventuria anomochaeta]|uniref:HET-domain-containing protein n=1 Tax=Macroventuria anomochaeta TaxID=301207 RepID=A0ACB6RP80_9PLEO|nr:HET-domain-containing protein [Macroventuria anomochaeta]KAF2623584.1 HET-domain-containing protein [Macroventuria anomochaeta]